MSVINIRNICIILIAMYLQGCSSTVNSPATGFLLEESDSKAIKIADQVMKAMGGQKAWKETRYLTWDFFGSRFHIWDKKENRVLVWNEKKKNIASLNLNTMEGKVMIDGKMKTNPDSIAFYMQKTKEAWINDSYWLVMPFKLKDSGVRLKYVKKEDNHDILELTFKSVGVTPQNKYHVYVDQDTHLIDQWDFFDKATDAKPRFSTPWKDYKKYGSIMLSGDRGGDYQLTNIAVPGIIQDRFFEVDTTINYKTKHLQDF